MTACRSTPRPRSPLENKAQVEILKGTSGVQAGTSAPGGLVNFVVKRPTDAPIRSAFIEYRQGGDLLGSVDLSQRFGGNDAFGLRVNAAAERLSPLLPSAKGHRNLLAVAADWRLGADTLLEAEVETSHRSQPSVPGFSLLGDTVPRPTPRINLNDQPWSLPVVFDATTASLRWQQKLDGGWRFVAHAATQRLRTDDRTAFPFGCTDPNPPPDGTYYADRYCPNGNFDLYDFRSENERRRDDVVDLSLQGKVATSAFVHAPEVGVQRSRVRNRFQFQAYNYAGTGNVNGTVVTPPAPLADQALTNRDEDSTELYLRDAVAVTERATLWFGARHTKLERRSIGTDGSAPTAYGQSITTPFAAASYAYAPGQSVYASWGRGVESAVVPNRPSAYTDAGQALPALKSRQVELGLKGGSDRAEWGLAVFDIVQPRFDDVPATGCAPTPPPAPAIACFAQTADGSERHRGIEGTVATRFGAWDLHAGTQWLRARREGRSDAALNGLQPTNVPALTLRLQAGYSVAAIAGLSLQAALSHESSREVLPDDSIRIPGYTRVDAAARYETRIDGRTWTWRAGIDNLLDKQAWRESPYQFGHAYLFPLAPRTARVSLQIDL